MPVVKATRLDWIEAGLELYGIGGRAAINVERLAVAVGAAKAGFYWHFTDRDTFLAALIDHWYAETTERLAIDGPFEQFARAVFNSRKYVDVEWQLRREAVEDPALQRRLADIDARRVRHIGSVLAADGHVVDDDLAAVLYDQFLGWASRRRAPTAAQVRRQVELAQRVVARFGA